MSIENGPSADNEASNSAMPRGAPFFSVMGEAAVLDGFSNMGGTDAVAGGEVGNGPGDFQDAVPGPGREVEPGDRLLEQRGAGCVRRAVVFDLAGAEPGIALGLPLVLAGKGRLDAGPNGGRAFRLGLAT